MLIKCLVWDGEGYLFIELVQLLCQVFVIFRVGVHRDTPVLHCLLSFPFLLDFESVFEQGFELGAWVCTIMA